MPAACLLLQRCCARAPGRVNQELELRVLLLMRCCLLAVSCCSAAAHVLLDVYAKHLKLHTLPLTALLPAACPLLQRCRACAAGCVRLTITPLLPVLRNTGALHCACSDAAHVPLDVYAKHFKLHKMPLTALLPAGCFLLQRCRARAPGCIREEPGGHCAAAAGSWRAEHPAGDTATCE